MTIATRRETLGSQLKDGRAEIREVAGEFAAMGGDIRDLARSEADLLRAEMQEQIQLAKQTAIWGAVAAVTGLVALFFVGLTLMFALDTVMDLWLAALITTLVMGAIVAFAGMAAMRRAKSISPMPRASQIKQDANHEKVENVIRKIKNKRQKTRK
jgi:ABC-type multidrug transport system fused ATPase/permease subunit